MSPSSRQLADGPKAGFELSRFVELDPAVAQGEDDRLGTVVDRELAQDRGDVILDRLVGDLELKSDLFVAVALRDIIENLDLTRRQRRKDPVSRFVQHRELLELVQDP
jgi:hypothetical protein